MRKASLFAIDIPESLWRWLGAFSVLVLSALAIVPVQTLERLPAVCPFKRYFGIDCYGCGMTRALCALLHGNLRLALQYNRGVLVAFSILILCGACLALPELKKAFVLSWLFLTIITTGTLLAPVVLSQSQIARIAPRCAKKRTTGRPCFFCGMTTGFIDIVHGHILQAERANGGSVPLYAGFLGNGLCLCIFLTGKGRRS